MRVICCALVVLFFVSCHQKDSVGHQPMGKELIEDEYQMVPPRTAEPAAPPNEIVINKGSKIIKHGVLKFEVNQLEEIKVDIDSLVKNYDGYYEDEKFSSYRNRKIYSLKIRIPTEKFKSLILNLEDGIGRLVSKDINQEDVTEEYVDLKLRLENKLAYLKQYKIILKKAKTIKEILAVQEKIRNIEEEIESKKGRIKHLEDQVGYSTLHVELSALESHQDQDSNFGERILIAFTDGFKLFLEFIIGGIYLWPFLLSLALVILGWKTFRKRSI